MNELLAQAYGTADNIAANTEEIEKNAAEAAFAEGLDQLEKIAAAEGIDLNEFTDDEIVEILTEALNGETEKTAEAVAEEETVAEEAVETDEGHEKLAEADFLGRTMAHAFYDELTAIQNGGTEAPRGRDAFMKEAAAEEPVSALDGFDFSDEEFANAFHAAGIERANDILEMLDGGEVKQSSATYDDEKLDTAVTEYAGRLLDEAGYDVAAIAEHLS